MGDSGRRFWGNELLIVDVTLDTLFPHLIRTHKRLIQIDNDRFISHV